MSLWINDSGADNDEIQRGVDAASAYFDRIGWRPSLVWRLRIDDENASRIWSAAETRAFKAAFDGWAVWPEAASLVWNGEASA